MRVKSNESNAICNYANSLTGINNNLAPRDHQKPGTEQRYRKEQTNLLKGVDAMMAVIGPLFGVIEASRSIFRARQNKSTQNQQCVVSKKDA